MATETTIWTAIGAFVGASLAALTGKIFDTIIERSKHKYNLEKRILQQKTNNC
jgi:hypothetical protein